MASNEAGQDAGIDGTPDSAPDQLLLPDGPKIPAHWKTVPGTGPVASGVTATKLKDGRVLVTGGYTYKSPTQATKIYHGEAWIYDPTQNSFGSAGLMTSARLYHTASLLPDGRVLVVGGDNKDGELDTFEFYDPKQPAASAWTAGPKKLAGTRSGHEAVTLSDGRVLVLGGGRWDGGAQYLDSMIIYDPSKADFTQLAQTLKKGRMFFTAALLSSGKVLVAGGDDGSSAFTDSLELFDPQSGVSTPLTATLSSAKAGPVAVTLKNGKVLITGGYTFGDKKDDLYDPATNSVNGLTHPGGTRRACAAALLNDGSVLVVGGWDSTKAKQAVAFDSAGGGSWTNHPDMQYARSGHAAVLLNDGSVLVVGGREGAKNTFAPQSERFYP